MSYLVLARKWRPTRFDDVVGQRHVTQTLQNSIRRERVPHALLFIGSRGVGKTSCARIFAKALNCLSEDHPVPTPCDTCPSCESVNQGASVDVYEIDGASNNGVEQVRELRESTQFKPSVSRFKIYIIDEVHMLSVGAFNALLKTLEEPPPHVKFIFATTEPHKIPDTIISRCQRFDFKRISVSDITSALMKICEAEGVQAERAALEQVAREAQGGMRDSLSLLDQLISFCGTEVTALKTREVLGLTSREMMLGLISAIHRQDASEVLSLIHDHAEAGADLKRLTTELLELLRDLMVMKVHPQPSQVLELPPSELSLIAERAAELQVGEIHHTFQTLVKRADEIQRSAHPKLILEMTLLQMCHQADTATLSEVMGGLLQLESHLNAVGLSEGLPPLAPPPSYRPPSVSHHLGADSSERQSLMPPQGPNQVPSQGSSQGPSQGPDQRESTASHTSVDHSSGSSAIPQSNPVPSTSEPSLPSSGQVTSAQVSLPPSQSPQPQQPESSQPEMMNEEESLGHSQAQSRVAAEAAPDLVAQTHTAQIHVTPSLNTSSESSSSSGPTQEYTLDAQSTGVRLPRHPPLPLDLRRSPKRGEGVDELTYRWLSHANEWITAQNSFFAAELRVRSRITAQLIDDSGLTLTFGGEPPMLQSIQEALEHITPQMLKSAEAVGRSIPKGELRIQLEELTPRDERWEIESLSDYHKRLLAQRAIKQMEDALTSDYVSRYREAFGGHVFYMVPPALNEIRS